MKSVRLSTTHPSTLCLPKLINATCVLSRPAFVNAEVRSFTPTPTIASRNTDFVFGVSIAPFYCVSLRYSTEVRLCLFSAHSSIENTNEH